MKRWYGLLALLALVVGTASLAAHLPARVVAGWLRPNLAPQVALAGVSGTVWHPRAQQITVALPQGPELKLGPAELDLGLWRLITGAVGVHARLEAYGGQLQARGWLGWGGRWQVQHLQGRLPLGNLARVDPRLAMAQLDGRALIRSDGLRGQADQLQGGGIRLGLTDLAVGWLAEDRPLGDFSLPLAIPEPDKLTGELSSASGNALRAQGELALDRAKGRIRFTGEAWAGANANATIREALPLLGRMQGERALIRYQGRLR